MGKVLQHLGRGVVSHLRKEQPVHTIPIAELVERPEERKEHELHEMREQAPGLS